MADIANLRVRIGADTSGLEKSLNSAKNSVSGFAKAIAATLATIGITDVFRKATKAAMDVEAALQQVNRTMGASAAGFTDWANNGAMAFNMGKTDAIKFGAVFSNLISTFAKDTATTTRYTEDLLKSSAVVASSTGRSMTDVMERIRSGMLGNTEAIEDLGINVGISMISSTEAFKKFANGKSWAQLDFQTQQQIRLFAILEQSTKKYGDAVADNTNSRLQQFIAQLKNVQLSLGQAFLPIFNAILPALTAMANGLARTMAIFAQFSQAIFGKANTGKATEDQAAAVGSLGDAYEEAGKQAHDSVAGFDEVNTLSSQSGSGGANVGGGAATMPDLQKPEVDTATIPSKIQEMADKIKGIIGSFDFQPSIDAVGRFITALEPLKTFSAKGLSDFYNDLLKPIGTWVLGEGVPRFVDTLSKGLEKINWEPINAGLDKVWKAIEPFAINIGEGLLWFWENVLVPLGTWTMNEIVPVFLDILAAAIVILNAVIEALKPLTQWLWDNFLEPLAVFTGGVIVSVLNDLAGALKVIGDWMSENKETVAGITIAIIGFFGAWKVVELLSFIETSGGLIKAFRDIAAAVWAATGAKIVNAAETAYLTTLYAIDFVRSIAASIVQLSLQTAAWWSVTAAMIANKVEMIIATVSQWAMVAATTAYNIAVGIAAAATWLLNAALAVLTAPITLIIAAIALLVIGVYELIKHWDDVKRVAAATWESMKQVWGVAYDWMKTNVINPIANLYIGLFNGIINGINWVIRALNTIHFDLPDWIPGIGGKGFGISIPEIPNIPKLAKGGITNGEMLATIGDNAGGREVVSPLDDLMGMITSAVSTAIQMVGGGNQSNDNKEIVIQTDGVAWARIHLPYLNRENQRIGSNAIMRSY